ncbi:hypothetical protein BSIN_1750 [Burkholderia singularis]|uniref:Uncharacterized protein n=1 Tax=Burkholderia singularis TaxID=1503053 RepID=A0A238GZQ8_9BURK|nr:hypothetical protein BSIN_1750 [Burkholderia singularis]
MTSAHLIHARCVRLVRFCIRGPTRAGATFDSRADCENETGSKTTRSRNRTRLAGTHRENAKPLFVL